MMQFQADISGVPVVRPEVVVDDGFGCGLSGWTRLRSMEEHGRN